MRRSSSGNPETGSENRFVLLPDQSEIDVRVAEFVRNHNDDSDEISQSQNFWIDFFSIFGRTVRPDAQFERHMRDDIAKEPRPSERMDLFWENILLIEQKSSHVDVEESVHEAFYYHNNTHEHKQARYVLGCNFKEFHLYEPNKKKDWKFGIKDLPKKLELFEFMRIGAPVSMIIETPVNRKATELMGKIYDEFVENNYDENDLQLLLVRLAYCYFADDTGLFGKKDAFLEWFSDITNATGKDAGPQLIQFFEILDKPIDKRQTTQKEFNSFPYVNGKLFSDTISTPVFDSDSRQLLIDVGRFNWSFISPAIFGNLFQGVMKPDLRHDLGAHYTAKDNIMRVIWPLFLEKYWKEFESIKNGPDKKIALLQFQKRLSKLEFLDPACGSGNFLIVAYEQLRELEIDILKEVYCDVPEHDRPAVERMSLIGVNQFHGIEIHPFAVRIAQTSLWMMDHLMNKKLAAEFGRVFAKLPLDDIQNIHQCDALEKDWNEVVESSKCSYVFGNPPFIGAKKMKSGSKEKIQTEEITGSGQLDYVSNWFVKAGKYVGDNTPIGFVATNSITQGEQVGKLWPIIYDLGLDMVFAYESFKWDSEAKGKARVWVVIIGLSKNPKLGGKRIFNYDGKALIAQNFRYISPYIIGSDKKLPIVTESSQTLNSLPNMKMGSKPIDGGNYIFKEEQMRKFLQKEPRAKKYLRPYVGAKELIEGYNRWILSFHDIELTQIKKIPMLWERVNAVRSVRKASSAEGTRKLGDTPTIYHLNVLPTSPFLVIPGVSSERRDYIPIDYLEPPIIPNNRLWVLENDDLAIFGLLTSKMHMVWMILVTGRLEMRFSYSPGVVYNTFPIPDGLKNNKKIQLLSQTILDIRSQYPNNTLKHLYDPDLMPADLIKAHKKLDKAIDGLYRKKPFNEEQERIVFLLEKYGKMIKT